MVFSGINGHLPRGSDLEPHSILVGSDLYRLLQGHACMLRRLPLLDLTNFEPSIAAQVCGAMTRQESERARKIDNSTACGLIEQAAKHCRTLGETFELERRT